MADDGDEKFIDWMTDLRSEPRAFRIKTKSRVTVTNLRLYSLYVRVCAAAAKSCCRLSAARTISKCNRHVRFTPPQKKTHAFAQAQVYFGPMADISSYSITSSARASSVGGTVRRGLWRF